MVGLRGDLFLIIGLRYAIMVVQVVMAVMGSVNMFL